MVPIQLSQVRAQSKRKQRAPPGALPYERGVVDEIYFFEYA